MQGFNSLIIYNLSITSIKHHLATLNSCYRMKTFNLTPFKHDESLTARSFDIIRGVLLAKKIKDLPPEKAYKKVRCLVSDFLSYSKMKER